MPCHIAFHNKNTNSVKLHEASYPSPIKLNTSDNSEHVILPLPEGFNADAWFLVNIHHLLSGEWKTIPPPYSVHVNMRSLTVTSIVIVDARLIVLPPIVNTICSSVAVLHAIYLDRSPNRS